MAQAATSARRAEIPLDGSGFRELQDAMFRRTAAGVGALFVILHYALVFSHPPLLRAGSGLVIAIVVLATLASLRAVASMPLLAYLLWSTGTTAAVVLTAMLLNMPAVAFAVLVIPLTLMLTATWQAALLGTGIGAAAALLLSVWPNAALLPPSTLILLLAMACLLAIPVLGGTMLMHTLVDWYEAGYHQSERRMEEARSHRMVLQQVQEDLVQNQNELARLNQRQAGLIEAADEARRSKERFVATVSHELRTPLNMIIGFSEIIAQSPAVYGVSLPPMLQADVASIRRNSEHLLEMVDDVLDLARIDAGRLSLEREWLSAATLMAEAADAVQPLFQAKGLALRQEVAADEMMLYCDGTRIREVLINLLSNAGRLTTSGGASVRGEPSGDVLRFSVHDTGPGIPPNELRRIFDPFQQVGNAVGGTGLGLTISQEIIELHGGKMEVESKVGVGSVFSFTLPRHDPAAQSPAQRWNNPYMPYQPRTRRSLAPMPASAGAWLVLDERDGALARTLARHNRSADTWAVTSVDEAAELLTRSMADLVLFNQALCTSAERARLIALLPPSTVAIGCRLPAPPPPQSAPAHVRRISKPVSREALLQALHALGPEIHDVLLVDDNLEVLQLFGRILTAAERPYRVLRAANGRQALQMLRRRKPDAMILDLLMPEMSGEEVLEEMGNDVALQKIPVLVVTSQIDREQVTFGEQLEIVRSSPMTMQELFALLGAITSAFQPTRGQAPQETPPV